MQIINPATEEIITELPEDTLESIQAKLVSLRKGQKEWAKKPVEERLAIIIQFGELVKANKEELAFVLTSETGKPIAQSRNEVNGSLNRIEHLKTNALKWLATETVATGDVTESIAYDPLGVIANISGDQNRGCAEFFCLG